MNKIFFVSSNDYKAKEIRELIKDISDGEIVVECIKEKILEQQTDDIDRLVRKKAIDAYKKVNRPVIVDHTAFEVEEFNKLPGALTNIFWERLKSEGFIKLFRCDESAAATAITVIGYCDGKQVKLFRGEQMGVISDIARGNSEFQWDTLFIPCGETETFAELGKRKNAHSMRKKALEKLTYFLMSEHLESDFNNDTILEEIADIAISGKLILFIGSGVSSSIVELCWKDLMDKLGESLGYEKGLFTIQGNFYELGEYYKIATGSYSELINILQQSYNNIDEKIAKSDILKNICNIGAHTIYTTNYDNILEKAHSINNIKFNKISNANDFGKTQKDHVKIIKLHGDISDDNNFVLSESSYLSRINMNTPLDLKIMSDILEHSVLFLGYSLSDINIRNMLYTINQHYENNIIKNSYRPKLYFLTTQNNKIKREILRSWNVHTILSEKWDKESALNLFLQDLVAKIKNKQ